MKKGFTLIELAIVVIIIGLAASGVLAGKELIKQANLKKHIDALREVDLAFKTFKLKYNDLPGDIPNPERFFPECINPDFDLTDVIIGNNDDMIESWYTGVYHSDEGSCVWMHMAQAGLYQPLGFKAGDFNGIIPVNVDPSVAAISIMKWKPDENMIASVSWARNQAKYDAHPATINSNVLEIQTSYSTGFYGADLYNIDKKIDDGKPGLGTLIALAKEGTDLEMNIIYLDCFDNYITDSPGNETPVTTDSSNYIIDTGLCSLMYKLE